MEPLYVTCPHCHASVPVLDERGATCVFCLQGVPVPAESSSDERRRRLKRSLSTTLSEVRRTRRVWRASHVVQVLFALALAGAAAFAVSMFLGDPIIAGLVGGATLAVTAGLVTLYRGRHWRRAAVPPARITVDDVLLGSCRHCDNPILSPCKGVVAKCRLCRTKNLVPAPLVSERAYRDYREMLARLRAVASPGAVRIAARTFRTEFGGWVLLAIGMLGATAWLVTAQSAVSRSVPFLSEPIGQLGVPAGFASILGIVGLWDALRSRRRRGRVQRVQRAW